MQSSTFDEQFKCSLITRIQSSSLCYVPWLAKCLENVQYFINTDTSLLEAVNLVLIHSYSLYYWCSLLPCHEGETLQNGIEQLEEALPFFNQSTLHGIEHAICCVEIAYLNYLILHTREHAGENVAAYKDDVIIREQVQLNVERAQGSSFPFHLLVSYLLHSCVRQCIQYYCSLQANWKWRQINKKQTWKATIVGSVRRGHPPGAYQAAAARYRPSSCPNSMTLIHTFR